MSRPGKKWRHVTIGAYASWLPGDPRGWRARDHKRHSSGDYRHRPPEGEHAGLYRYSLRTSGSPTFIDADLRVMIGRKFVEGCERLEHQLLVISVSAKHVHALLELPGSRSDAKHEIGRCKQSAALAAKKLGVDRLWAGDCGLKTVRDRQHQRNAYDYILDHFNEGAWVWSFRDGELGIKGD